MTDPQVSELGQAIQEVTEKMQLLVREEIALAQAEMTAKVQKLIRGIVAGAIAGIFALFGLIYLLHAASWGIWELLGTGNGPWLGFLITTNQVPGKRSPGSLSWGGINNTFFWIDPSRGIGGVIMMQYLPFADARALVTYDAFERGAYQLVAEK